MGSKFTTTDEFRRYPLTWFALGCYGDIGFGDAMADIIAAGKTRGRTGAALDYVLRARALRRRRLMGRR